MAVVKEMLTPDDGYLFEGNVNPWLKGIKGIKFSRRIWVSFANINTDAVLNKARKAGSNYNNKESIKISIQEEGFNTSQPLPCLYELNPPSLDQDGNILKFAIISGNHRIGVLRSLGYEGFWFDIYELGKDGIDFHVSLAIAAQRAQTLYPGLESSQDDVVASVAYLVHSGKCENTEDAIRDMTKQCCPTANRKKVGNVVKQVARITKPSSSFVNWSAEDKDEMQDKLQKKYNKTSHGVLDRNVGKCGHTMLNKYSLKTIYTVMKNFHHHGNESYIIGHGKSPGSLGSLTKMRINILKEIVFYEKMLKTTFEHYQKTGKFPWEFIGFLPQDSTTELDAMNEGKLIQHTMDELLAIQKIEDAIQKIEDNSLFANSIGIEPDVVYVDDEGFEEAA